MKGFKLVFLCLVFCTPLVAGWWFPSYQKRPPIAYLISAEEHHTCLIDYLLCKDSSRMNNTASCECIKTVIECESGDGFLYKDLADFFNPKCIEYNCPFDCKATRIAESDEVFISILSQK